MRPFRPSRPTATALASRTAVMHRRRASTRLSLCTVHRGLGADERVHAAADAALDETLRGRTTGCDGSGMWTSEETTHIAIRVPCVRAQPPDRRHFVNALEALRSSAGEYGLVVRRLHQLGANTTFGFFGSAWVFGSGGLAMTTSFLIVRVREDVLRGLFDSAYALAVRRAPRTGGCADPTLVSASQPGVFDGHRRVRRRLPRRPRTDGALSTF
ncbi:hypothetical protein C8F04DRAFT_1390651 [Mycena alexandri]|uniref:Uncharacterized protein n=1 Tax=Mycena alexandri TaxID=1745969 RepID=A0AAD6TAW8_9AGAR|nr:hypothetical protein C8F04DRAFT_1390651 [Mycena alexandri]